MHHSQQDIGAKLAARYATAGVDVTAGGSGDDTEVNGAWIDRQDFLSCKVVIAYRAVLAEGETLSLAANLQDSPNGSTGINDFGSAMASATVATGGSGGSTEEGVIELDFDLLPADRYIRAQFTPDLSAANTDTAELAAVVVLGGADRNPVTASQV